MYIIDSDILVAELLAKYYQEDDAKKFVSFYRRIPLMKRVIPDYILSEFELFMMHVMPVRYSMDFTEKKQLHDIVIAYLRQINNHCTISAPNSQIVKTAFSLYQHRFTDQETDTNHISYTDCLLLAMASELQYTVLSPNQRLIAYAHELHIPHYTPPIM